MNRRKNDLIQLGILVALGASTILSLTIPQLSQERTSAPIQALSVLTREADGAVWNNTRMGMEQAADELGAELRFLTLSSPNDTQEQISLVQREIEGGADALIISPTDPDALSCTLNELGSPCPVVATGSPLSAASALIAPDDTLVGQGLSQALLEDWTGGAVLLVDTSISPKNDSARRLAAAQEVLETAHIPTIIEKIATPIAPEELTQLVKASNCQWVMTFEPSATLSAAQQMAGLQKPPCLYGVGSSAAITAQLESGTIQAVAAWSDYAAGYLAVEYAISATTGRTAAPAPLTFSILRGEDIYAPDNQKLLFPVIS